MPHHALEILLVEDNDADVILVELAFEELALPHQLHVAHDGNEAMEFLNNQGRFADAPQPHLILLDLNMPGMTGLEVLLLLKDHPEWRNIPVIVMTADVREKTIWEGYHQRVNAYMLKPSNVAEFVEGVRALTMFWSVVATLPPRNKPPSLDF